MTIDNMLKYNNYMEQFNRLKKALHNEFYLEALFIEYVTGRYNLVKPLNSHFLVYASARPYFGD